MILRFPATEKSGPTGKNQKTFLGQWQEQSLYFYEPRSSKITLKNQEKLSTSEEPGINQNSLLCVSCAAACSNQGAQMATGDLAISGMAAEEGLCHVHWGTSVAQNPKLFLTMSNVRSSPQRAQKKGHLVPRERSKHEAGLTWVFHQLIWLMALPCCWKSYDNKIL